MRVLRSNSRLSTRSLSLVIKLSLMGLMGVLGLTGVAVYLALAYSNIQNSVLNISESYILDLERESTQGVVLNRVYSDIELLRTTFWENTYYLNESAQLIQFQFDSLKDQKMQPELALSLKQLRAAFNSFHERASSINFMLDESGRITQQLMALLDAWEQALSQQIIENTLQDRSIDYHEQVLVSVLGFRESVLTLSRMNQQQRFKYLHEKESDTELFGNMLNLIDDLLLRVRTMTETQDNLGGRAKSFYNRVIFYRDSVARLDFALESMMFRMQEMDLIQSEFQRQLILNQRHLVESTAAGAEQINQYLNQAGIYLLVTMVSLLSLVFFSTLWFVRNNIQRPLRALLEGIQRVGDINAPPISLGRGDEWGLIAQAINEMKKRLADFYARLESSEARYRYLAQHDPLTGLPNRLLLQDRFEQASIQAQRDETHLGLFFLDLDHFKQVNDTLGHDQGDALLKAVVTRVQAVLRQSDTITRQGGDEFIILASGMSNSDAVKTLAAHIIKSMQKPFVLNGESCAVTFSLGISLYPEDGQDFEGLLMKADSAMYRAKATGRNTYCLYDEVAGGKK